MPATKQYAPLEQRPSADLEKVEWLSPPSMNENRSIPWKLVFIAMLVLSNMITIGAIWKPSRKNTEDLPLDYCNEPEAVGRALLTV